MTAPHDPQLDAWQDSFLEHAKDMLREHKELQALALIRTRAASLPEAAIRFKVPPEGMQPLDGVALMIPLSYDNPTMILDMLSFTAPSPKAAEFLAEGRREFGDQHVYDGIVAHIESKDIVARFLSAMCSRVSAEAILKMDEVWTKEMKKREADLANDPEAGEAILSVLETPTYRRIIQVPFTRTARGYPNPITGFGEPFEFPEDESHASTGRFLDLLKPRTEGLN